MDRVDQSPKQTLLVAPQNGNSSLQKKKKKKELLWQPGRAAVIIIEVVRFARLLLFTLQAPGPGIRFGMQQPGPQHQNTLFTQNIQPQQQQQQQQHFQVRFPPYLNV